MLHGGWELNYQVRPGHDPARRVHATRLSLLQTTCEHPISTPQKGCGTPYPHNSPLLKESSASPEDLAKSSAALPVVIDVADDDEASVPVKSHSSNVKGTDEGSKQRESPPAKKAQTEDLEARKSKPRKVSRASRDE